MINTRKWGAYVGAGAIVFALAGCADRNNNGQPDSVASSGEVANAADSAGNKMAAAADTAGEKMGNAADRAGGAISNAASTAGSALSNAGEAATMTPKVKTAIGATPGLAGSSIDVDTLGSKDSIALRGTVKTAAQSTLAAAVAKKNAPGYKILNQLKVAK